MGTGKTDYRDSPVAWFVVLEDARRRADFKRAAHATEQLERLGISVRYKSKKEDRRNDP